MYIFKDEYKTGIDSIDNEHRRLFEIANQAYETLMSEFIMDKYDYIVSIINELKEYARTHFKHEEEYMLSIKYKKFFAQKLDHDKFLEKLDNYDLVSIDENQRDALLELLEFLNDWLTNHIVKSDKLIGME